MDAASYEDWPVARGGSARIADALASYLRTLGGEIVTSHRVASLDDLPRARVYLFDTDPLQLAAIAEPVLPAAYVRRLRRYRFGPGVFKLDFALDGPIPWRDPRCLEASTVHVGGTLEEIAASERAPFEGRHAEAPFVMVCQQSDLDPTRAPDGKRTGYAYVHVPAGSTLDQTSAIERQIERFAPGFRDRILARRATTAVDLHRHNPNYVGGAIAGGMRPKVEACIRAATGGVERTHIIDGRLADSILLEVFTGSGCGTMIVGRKEKATYIGVDLAT